MTVKTSISLTDQQEAFARSLVENGEYASLSAVIQRGLEMLRADHERTWGEIEALRAVLKKRMEGPFLDESEWGSAFDDMMAEQRRKHLG